MKHLVLKGDKVLEVHDTYSEAWGALVHLKANSIETVDDAVAKIAKQTGYYRPIGSKGYVLRLDRDKFYPKLPRDRH